jgi:hypothetical protein
MVALVVVVQAALMPRVHSKVVDIEQVLMMIQMQVSLMEFPALMAVVVVVVEVVEGEGGIEEEEEDDRVVVGEEEEGCTTIIIIIRQLSHCHHWVEGEGQQEGLVERSILIRHSDKTAIDIVIRYTCLLFPFVCVSTEAFERVLFSFNVINICYII